MTVPASALPTPPACQGPSSRTVPISVRDCKPSSGAVTDQVDFRQLRHLTNNALQAILREINQHQSLRRMDADRLICNNLERRILLTAAIADALFGLTHEPSPMPDRLRSLGESVVSLLGESGQAIDVYVSVAGECPVHLEALVLRVAHELLGNAVKHGMRDRIIGCISVDLISDAHRTVLTVTDDGWGCGDESGQGEGLRLTQLLADEHGGLVRLRCLDRETIATLDLPYMHRSMGRTTELGKAMANQFAPEPGRIATAFGPAGR